MDVLGFIIAFAVGLIMGIMGAGGAILTVPVMVYLYGIKPVTATVYSLFIVGCTSLIGSVSYLKSKLVDYKTALAFAVPSVISMFIARRLVIPAIPEVIFETSAFTLTKHTAVMLLFALLMLSAAISMIKGGVKEEKKTEMQSSDYIKLLIYGLFVGFLTGLVGAGGGFLIIPALVLLAKVPMKSAVGTSLIIIALNSLSGFLSDLTGDYDIDWVLILSFLAFAAAGILVGGQVTKKLKAATIKKAFGWFVLALGIYIIAKETILK